jgi:transposase
VALVCLTTSFVDSKSIFLIKECFWLIVTTEEWDMRVTTGARKSLDEKLVKDITWAMRKHYSSKHKVRIVLDWLRRDDNIAELCCREGLSQGIYFKRLRDFMQVSPAKGHSLHCYDRRSKRSATEVVT